MVLRIPTNILIHTNGTPIDMARLTYDVVKERYVCVHRSTTATSDATSDADATSDKNATTNKTTNKNRKSSLTGACDTWYRFRGHRWYKIGSDTVEKEIRDWLLDQCLYLISYYNENALHEIDDNKYEYLDKAKEVADKLYKIRAGESQTEFFEEFATCCFQTDFEEKLDKDTDLVCYENGVLELSSGLFRSGHPSDYMSKSTGKKYRPDTSHKDGSNSSVSEVPEAPVPVPVSEVPVSETPVSVSVSVSEAADSNSNSISTSSDKILEASMVGEMISTSYNSFSTT